MISFAGVALTPITDPDVKAYVARWTDAHAADVWERQYDTLANLHFPPPVQPQRRPQRPGILVWPNGGHRLCEFCEFVTREQADAILAAIADSGVSTATLVISDGTNSVTAVKMLLMGFRPVLQKGSQELYLMTLVDWRQSWWRAGASPTVNSWENAIKSVDPSASTWSVAAVPAAYKLPDIDHWLSVVFGGCPAALMAESLARQAGTRITLRPADGVFAVNDYTTAAALDASQWASYSDRVLLGGRWNVHDLNGFVVKSVRLNSYRQTQATGTAGPGGGSANVSLSTLALADFGGYVGQSLGTGLIVHDCRDDISSGDWTAYYTQAATDWYLWHLALTDATFSGIVPWVPTGFEDRIEWVHDWDADAIYTRVVPAPRHDHSFYGTLPFSPMPLPLHYLDGAVDNYSRAGQIATGQGGVWGLVSLPNYSAPANFKLRLTLTTATNYAVSWVSDP